MFDIDFSKIGHYKETHYECSRKLITAIKTLEYELTPTVTNFMELSKETQSLVLNAVVKTTTDLICLLKTVHNLDINKGNNEHYLSVETR